MSTWARLTFSVLLLVTACGGAEVAPASAEGTAAQYPPSEPAAELAPARGFDSQPGCRAEVQAPPAQGELLDGTPLALIFNDEMGSFFELRGISFVIDGEVVFESNVSDDDPGALDLPPPLALHTEEGPHILDAYVAFRSNPPFRTPYVYVRSYCFRLRARHRFFVERGTLGRIRVFAYERGNVTTPYEERPALRFE